MISISVLIITYNQGKVIGRALDSVLQQKDWGLKEIVVCDDNSKDNNWEVIQSYVQKYPQYIRAYRNEPNLGIYLNVEKTYELRGDADAFIELAGDDALLPDYFKTVQQFINKNQIDMRNKASLICFDFKIVRPNGMAINIKSNKKLEKCKDPYRLKVRGIAHGRGKVMSHLILEKYKKVAEGKSVTLAECLCEIQPFEHAEKVFYCPFIASVYYSQLGISTSMKNADHYRRDIEKWDFIYNNINLCKKDKYYALMRKYLLCYVLDPSISNLKKLLCFYLKSRDFSLPMNPMSYYFSIRMILKSTFI